MSTRGGHRYGSPDLLPQRRALTRSASESCVASTSASKRSSNPAGQQASMGVHPIYLTKTQWQHVVVAFLSGILVAYAFFTFRVSMCVGHPSLGLAPGFGQESPWGVLQPTVTPSTRATACSRPEVPRGFAMSLLALSRETGDPLAVPDKLIVAARHEDDTSWLDIYLSHIPHVVYQVDDPENTIGAQHATLANKGNEAMAYLQFIVDYYDRLPPVMVFLHGHRGTWHLKDHVPLLQRLRWGELPFANLRYSPGSRLDWECGNRTGSEEFRRFDCDWQGSHLRPRDLKPRKARELTAGNKDCWWDSVELREVWPEVYEAELGELPAELKAPCCAEFMVARERVLAHPRSFYLHLRDWIVETELGRYRSGRVFEYMWHVIFGEPHVIEAVPECSLLFCDVDVEQTYQQ